MTKKILFMLLFMTASALSASAIKDVKIDVEHLKAPVFEFRDSKFLRPVVKSDNLTWLAVRVVFVPDAADAAGETTLVRKKDGDGFNVDVKGWLDELSLTVRVIYLIENKPVSMFSGKCLFRTVKGDGKDHVALMFIPPQILERYCPKSLTGAVKPNAKNKKIRGKYAVEAVFSHEGKVKAREYCNVMGSAAVQRKQFSRWASELTGGMIVHGAVLPKSKSPWALLAPDSFELEKNEGVAQE